MEAGHFEESVAISQAKWGGTHYIWSLRLGRKLGDRSSWRDPLQGQCGPPSLLPPFPPLPPLLPLSLSPLTFWSTADRTHLLYL